MALRLTGRLLAVAGATACFAGPQPQVLPPVSGPVATLDTVARGSETRFVVRGHWVNGVVARVSAESLTITRSGVDTTIARAAVDTVWVRRRMSYQGTGIGLALGLAVSGGMVLGAKGGGGDYVAPAALRLFFLILGFGVVADVGAVRPWAPVPASAITPTSLPAPPVGPTDTIPQ